MKASINLGFTQNLVLTPQLQQSIKLLQLSANELEQELMRFDQTWRFGHCSSSRGHNLPTNEELQHFIKLTKIQNGFTGLNNRLTR